MKLFFKFSIFSILVILSSVLGCKLFTRSE
jgi:hypothetical protein